MGKTNLLIYVFLILALKHTALLSQEQGSLMTETMLNKKVNYKKITQYKHSMPLADSSKINPHLEDTIGPNSIEYYNANNQILRVEYYHSNGEIRDAYDTYYQDGKILMRQPDSVLAQPFTVKEEYEHLPGNTLKMTSYYRNGDKNVAIFKRNCKGEPVAEYSLSANLDTISTINYSYDLNGNRIAILWKRKASRGSMYSIFNEENKVVKTFVFDSLGAIQEERSYEYIDSNQERTCYLNHEDTSIECSKLIYFTDEAGNVYKSYSNSKYAPNKWIVTSYKIEYRTKD